MQKRITTRNFWVTSMFWVSNERATRAQLPVCKVSKSSIIGTILLFRTELESVSNSKTIESSPSMIPNVLD